MSPDPRLPAPGTHAPLELADDVPALVTSPAVAATSGAAGTDALRERIAADLDRARARTAVLTDAVDDADLVAQHSRLMSPLVWDLAHVGNQ